VAEARGFNGGLRLDSHKREATARPIAVIPAPAIAVMALDQGDGESADPRVGPGDGVAIGTEIARAPGQHGRSIHSPVCGKVVALTEREIPTGAGRATCMLIENDGTDRRDPACRPIENYAAMAPDALLALLQRSGLAGLGGAAFPTAAKLATARAMSIRHLVLNGAECEPWICCDDMLMRERAESVVFGAQVMLHATGAGRCTIALEDDKPEAAAALTSALREAGDERLSIEVLAAIYPAGGERQLLTAVTGLEVPSGALPASVGLLCHNVGTAAALAEFVRSGEPLVRRIVTVTGGVARPGNVSACIGTPIAELVETCGGYAGRIARLIAGGSMTGRALPSDEAPVTKSLNCVVAARPEDLLQPLAERPCIRCGDCADVCPANLLPQQLHWAARSDDAGLLGRHGLFDCIECGCCDYVCPSRIPLTQRFRIAKAALAAREREVERAAAAQQRFEQRERRLAAEALAERQALDELRRQARGPGSGQA
jgi:electron transport complex protein RnfC